MAESIITYWAGASVVPEQELGQAGLDIMTEAKDKGDVDRRR